MRLRGKLMRLERELFQGKGCLVNQSAKPPTNEVSPATTLGADNADCPLGLLAGKAKEAPDCWNPCEETEQLFHGAETSQG